MTFRRYLHEHNSQNIARTYVESKREKSKVKFKIRYSLRQETPFN